MLSDFFGWLIETSLVLTWFVLFVLIGGAGEIGYRIGRRCAATRQVTDSERGTIGTLVAAMVTLLAFGLGLTISFAQNRFEQRRDLVAQEANAIGTAWLRAGLFDAPHGPDLQRMIADYTKLRLTYLVEPDKDIIADTLQRTQAAQTEMWAVTREIARLRPDAIGGALVSAMNEMIDLQLSQRFAYTNRVPVYLLWAVLVGSLLAIGAMEFQFGVVGHRQPVLATLLVFMWTGAIILIIDLNRPRLGEVRIDPSPLIWTMQGFTPPLR